MESREINDQLAQDADTCRHLILHRIDQCQNEPKAVRREIDNLLDLSRSNTRSLTPLPPLRLPACDHLDAALALGRNGPEAGIARAITAIAPALRWTYSYPDDPRWPGLASSVAFAQIAGPRGLVPDDRLLLGLTLVAPGTVYPRHVHPAVEFYLVIAGTALWQVGHTDAVARPPGSLIFHPSGIAHAMTTANEPLLAAFTWHGDIGTPSVYQM